VATSSIAKGAAVRKYNQIIGFATSDIAPGDQLFSNSEGKAVGNVTSVCHSAKVGGIIALAYVRRGFDLPGSNLEVRRDSSLIGNVEVRSLPFITSE